MLKSSKNSKILRWWLSIDSIMFMLVMITMCVGMVMTATASPAVAERIGVSSFYFLHRQVAFLACGLGIMIFLSTMSEIGIKRIAFFGIILSSILLILVLWFGEQVNGARRWLSIYGFSLQPSELLKPFYAIVIASILSTAKNSRMTFFSHHSKYLWACVALHVSVTVLLLLQPDFGMAATISVVTGGQLFVAGLPLLWLLISVSLFVLFVLIMYQNLPHVASRIDAFLDSSVHANYQIDRSIASYAHGGFFGKGPGEGSVKLTLPDSHTDFIFAVAGEEMGVVFCIVVIALLVAILLRGVVVIAKKRECFCIYAVFGVLAYFGIQSIFNIGVTVNMFPTKGMTLPFISYGGSSVISFSVAIGVYLSLTKRASLPSIRRYSWG